MAERGKGYGYEKSKRFRDLMCNITAEKTANPNKFIQAVALLWGPFFLRHLWRVAAPLQSPKLASQMLFTATASTSGLRKPL